MDKRIILSESEKNRILGIHKNAILKEWNLLNEEDPVNPQNANNEVLLQGTDLDYDYKKVGDKYYFKLKENPQGPKAKVYKTQGKFKNWTPATNKEAINKISQLPALSTLTANKGPESVDGSDEKFDAPVQTVGTTTPNTAAAPTPNTAAAPTPNTAAAPTPNTAAAPTSQNPDIMADLKSASQIRQEFRQGKRDKNKAQRQYNQMVNKYNRLKDKMSPQDNTAYLQAINQLKTQIG